MIQELLKLIENVDPADTAGLDEIDLKACAYITGWTVIDGGFIGETGAGDMQPPPRYTRSRDALKAIRPKGWWLPCVSVITREGATEPVSCFSLEKTVFDGDDPSVMGTGETEELAELHAILQAIDYERSKC